MAQAIGQAAIQQGYRVLYRETHVLLDELAEAVVDGTRKEFMESLATVPLLIIDDFGMRKLPLTAAEDLLEIIMRRYERASTLLTSNRPVEDWGKLLGDVAAVTAMLDRILHHGHVLKCGPRSWRTKAAVTTRGRHSVIWPTWSGLRPAPRGGFAPATPSKTKTKTFLRRKNKEDSAPSRWSGPSRRIRGRQNKTCRNRHRRGKTTSCPGCGFVGRF